MPALLLLVAFCLSRVLPRPRLYRAIYAHVARLGE
nr:MAG TPA: hypothetical protein [Caudoviricetes sp.]